jgi:hypothetical protein
MISGSQTFTWEIEEAPPSTLTGSLTTLWPVLAYIPPISGTQILRWKIGVSGLTIDLVLNGAPTGLVGELSVAVYSEDQAETIVFPTTSGIVEYPAGTGRYVATVLRPERGRYLAVWTYGTQSVSTSLAVVRTGRLEVTGRLAA